MIQDSDDRTLRETNCLMLLRSMIRLICKLDPQHPLPDRAADYILRSGLSKNTDIMRASLEPDPTHAPLED